jgi:pimeloyl-ACP methyl ester carboxylesterase
MAVFVLIHGGGHGGWCWEHVVPLLDAHGHRVLTPDLPGLGADRTPALEVSLDLWGRSIVDMMRGASEPVILLGHSQGGLAISQAAEYAPELVKTLIYLTAFLPRDGEVAADLMNLIEFEDGESLVQISVSPDGQYLDFEPSCARAALYGNTPDARADLALSRLVPTPATVFCSPIRLSCGRYGAVPRVYIECLRDRAIPLRLQRAMHRASPCQMVFAIDTDHSSFYSAPEQLATLLLAIAAEGNEEVRPNRYGRGSRKRLAR